MEVAELASRLVSADGVERRALLQEQSALANVELAYTLKDICLEGWGSNPAQATGAADALDELAAATGHAEIVALAAWSDGIAALVNGQMEHAVARLDDSETRFLALGKPEIGAATQVSKLIALAMVGRYDEAIACGLRAKEVLLDDARRADVAV